MTAEAPPSPLVAAVYSIRNSEAEVFAQCRRKWSYSGALTRNLMPKGQAVSALWFGTGFHFALEDYHGYRRFAHPTQAFMAYVNASSDLPADWAELLTLGEGMLGYYADHWAPRRDDLRTLWVNGVPQVEVRWEVALDTHILATGTFDRVALDPWGRIVLVDYKTYKTFDFGKLERDRQVSTYLWAATALYGQVEGLMHMQFRKELPDAPKRLRNGEFSQDKSQGITHDGYKRALTETFGTIPEKYQAYLQYLLLQEDADGDALIRRLLVRRDPAHLTNHGRALLAQYREMADERTPIYPNPGWNCKTCAFTEPCMARDLDADEEFLLATKYVSRDTPTAWMAALVWPDGTRGVPYERSPA